MLEKIDTSVALSKEEYHSRLPDLRAELFELQRRCWETGLGAVIAFEGWAGAGKGDAITRLTERLEPRAFEIHAIRSRRTLFWVTSTPQRSQMIPR